MTTAQPELPAAQGAGAPITSLPPLPNPLHPRAPFPPGAGQAAVRALQQLGDGATSGSVEYPYPQTRDYPLPPLPPIPAPASASRRARRRSSLHAVARPDPDPPLPPADGRAADKDADGAALARAVPLGLDAVLAAHNTRHPDMPATLHYDRSALLVRVRARGHVWALLRTLDDGDDAAAVDHHGNHDHHSQERDAGHRHAGKILAVRFIPSRDSRPPAIHVLPPPGPSTVLSEHLTLLSLSVAALLYRLPHLPGLLDAPCYYCARHLSDADGLPLGMTGFIPSGKGRLVGEEAAVAAASAVANGGNGGEKDQDNGKGGAKDAKGGGKDGDGDSLMPPAPNVDGHGHRPEGRWVAWHVGCEV